MTSLLKRKPGRPSLSAEAKEGIRENIIQIARELFVNDGYENASMRKIAAKAGFAPTKIYYYFDNKKQILQHFWADISVDMWNKVKPTEEQMEGSAIEVIRHLMTMNIYYWLDNPKNYQLLIKTQDFKSDVNQTFDFYNSPGSKEYLQTLTGAVRTCMHEGTFKKDSVLFVCQLIMESNAKEGVLLASKKACSEENQNTSMSHSKGMESRVDNSILCEGKGMSKIK